LLLLLDLSRDCGKQVYLGECPSSTRSSSSIFYELSISFAAYDLVAMCWFPSTQVVSTLHMRLRGKGPLLV
jgi:hypothetical protein